MDFDFVSIGLNANDELVNLRKRVDELKGNIEQQAAEIARLKAENAGLNRQVEKVVHECIAAIRENDRLKAVVDEAFQMLGTANLWPADMITTVKRAMEIIADQRGKR